MLKGGVQVFETTMYSDNQVENYELLIKQLDALLEGETNQIANLANAAALLNQFFTDVNWVGFYIWEDSDQQLVLGPFQGLPACIRIPYGKGVCGTAAKTLTTQLVANVDLFPGHIACDTASKSEIVIPLVIGDSLYGVLDIDSPSLNRFDKLDQDYLEMFCHVLLKHLH